MPVTGVLGTCYARDEELHSTATAIVHRPQLLPSGFLPFTNEQLRERAQGALPKGLS